MKSNSSFVPKKYFHASFLNNDGKIAPSGVQNKSLTDAFKSFFTVFRALDRKNKDEFYDLVLYSQKLKIILEDNSQTIANKLHIDYLNSILNDTVVLKKLMESLWSNLKTNSWDIDLHYKKFYEKLPESKMCPFCALQNLIDSELGREDYDHLLFKAKYPLTSVCDNNIAPTCSECNRRFKKVVDVLFNDTERRKFRYPFVVKKSFEVQNLVITLDGSAHPDLELDNKGEWVINFVPEDDFNKSWFLTYDIKIRYESCVRNGYKKWIKELIRAARINENNINTNSLKTYINKYKENYKDLYAEYPIKLAYYNYIEKNMTTVLHEYMERIAI
ncbi:hypothetical protein [Chryseobacterium shandongense]|uniref:hypothetical protein n=1 Tax=Chryseobacterium shandongense TaxID=1493872 RepID=UPI000F4EC0B3|nr:hypothetical protein [Chryseobacterium shandongense]